MNFVNPYLLFGQSNLGEINTWCRPTIKAMRRHVPVNSVYIRSEDLQYIIDISVFLLVHGDEMAVFSGVRTIDGLEVLVDGQPLDPRTDIKQFSNRGFEWTYEGIEPTQLALAILARHLGDDQAALAQCDGFMRHIVANLDNDWRLTGEEIDDALAAIAKDDGG